MPMQIEQERYARHDGERKRSKEMSDVADRATVVETAGGTINARSSKTRKKEHERQAQTVLLVLMLSDFSQGTLCYAYQNMVDECDAFWHMAHDL